MMEARVVPVGLGEASRLGTPSEAEPIGLVDGWAVGCQEKARSQRGPFLRWEGSSLGGGGDWAVLLAVSVLRCPLDN